MVAISNAATAADEFSSSDEEMSAEALMAQMRAGQGTSLLGMIKKQEYKLPDAKPSSGMELASITPNLGGKSPSPLPADLGASPFDDFGESPSSPPNLTAL
jgi:hypothetical protein